MMEDATIRALLWHLTDNYILGDVEEIEEHDLNLLERLKLWRKQLSAKAKLEKTLHCGECKEEFQSMKLLLKHRRDVHRDEESTDDNFICLDGIYRCKLCNATKSSKSEIKNHLLSHVEAFDCLLCKRSFSSTYRYACHMKSHSLEDEFCCPLCGLKTLSSHVLFRHINRIHFKNFPYYCVKCDKGFNDVQVFKEHENFHKLGKIFVCIVCGTKFPYSRSLLIHQRRAHTVWIDGEVKNQCTMCKVKFAKEASLQNHMQTRHWGLKSHLCDNCGKGFTSRSKLNLHYRIHTGVKPFECGYCEKSFSKKYYLVLHVRTHTGEKPYSCEYCGKSFSQPSTLKIHVRSHTGEKPFACRICAAAFPVRASLTAHYKSCEGK